MPYKRAFKFRPTIVNQGNYTVDNDKRKGNTDRVCIFRYYHQTIILNFCHHINITFARLPACERIAVCDPYQL